MATKIESVVVSDSAPREVRLQADQLLVWTREVKNQIGPDGLFPTDVPRTVQANTDANTIYVSDTSGNDANAGTFDLPKKTVQAAITARGAKAVGVCDSADYQEALTLNGGVIFALAEKRPTFKGGVMVTSNFSNIDGATNRIIRDAIQGPSGALYVGTDNGMYKSTDGGATWAAFASLGGKNIISLSVSGANLVALNDTDSTVLRIDEAGTKTTIGSAVPAGRQQVVGFAAGIAAIVAFGSANPVETYRAGTRYSGHTHYASHISAPSHHSDSPTPVDFYTTNGNTASKVSLSAMSPHALTVTPDPFGSGVLGIARVWRAGNGNFVTVQLAIGTGYGTLAARSPTGALLWTAAFSVASAVTAASICLSPQGSEAIYLAYLTSTTQRMERVIGNPWTQTTGLGGNAAIPIEAAARVSALFGPSLVGVSNPNGTTRFEVLAVVVKHIVATASTTIRGIAIDSIGASQYTFEAGAFGITLEHCHLANAMSMITTTGRTSLKNCLVEGYTGNGAPGVSVGGPGDLENCIVTGCGNGVVIESLSSVKRCLITGNALGLVNASPTLVIEDSIIFGNSGYDIVASQPCEAKNSVVGNAVGPLILTDCVAGNPVLDADYHIADLARGYLFDSLAVGLAADGRDSGAWDVERDSVQGSPDIDYTYAGSPDRITEQDLLAGLATIEDQDGFYSDTLTGGARSWSLSFPEATTPDDGRYAYEMLRHMRRQPDKIFLFGFGELTAGWVPIREFDLTKGESDAIILSGPLAPGELVGWYLEIDGTAYRVASCTIPGGDGGTDAIITLDDFAWPTPTPTVARQVFIPVKIDKRSPLDYKPIFPPYLDGYDAHGAGYSLNLREAERD